MTLAYHLKWYLSQCSQGNTTELFLESPSFQLWMQWGKRRGSIEEVLGESHWARTSIGLQGQPTNQQSFPISLFLSPHEYIHIYIHTFTCIAYIYIYIHIYIYTYIYIYIYIYIRRSLEKGSSGVGLTQGSRFYRFGVSSFDH